MQLVLAADPRVQRPDGQVVALAPRDAALLAWLALEGPTPRERLAALLWPASAPEAARNALRQRLFHLKKQFGDGLVSGQVTLRLAAGIVHDLAEADDVLAGVALDTDGELADWLARQRARRGQRVRQSLAELAAMAEAACDWPDALAHGRELLALEPLSEEAHRRLIRVHYLAGDRAAALLAFDACERVLKHEVGTRPGPETMALLRLIEQAEAAAPATAPPAAAALLRPPRTVGREAALQALLAAWQAGLPVLLTGEPGIGKSRLLEDLAQAWPGTLRVRARPGDAGVPLALLARLLAALAGPGSPCQGWAALRTLQALLAAPPSPYRPAPQPLAPPLVDLLAALSALPRPPALVFDDWQFADEASVELLGAQVEGWPALRWAVASRSGAGAPAAARLAALCEHGAWRSVSLTPLTEADIGDLLTLLTPDVGPAVAQADLAAAIARRIGGNPLYVLEALRHLRASGLPLEPRHVMAPQQVKELVAERLAQLPGPARQLLQLAAVAGSDFDVELAEAVTGRSALELAEAWAQLERLGLFGAHGAAHDVHAEVAAEHLPAPIARVLHARVAGWLEARPVAAMGAAQPARLAAHWQAAGAAERAQPHWLAAARQAWHAARHAETFEFFERAAQTLAAQGDTDGAFDLWFDAADAMSEIGTPALVARCLQAMQALARTAGQTLRLRLVQAVLSFSQGELEAGAVRVGALLGDAIALGDARVETECRFALANRAAADGRFDDALQQLAAGERLARSAGDPRRAASLAASMAMVLALRGQPRLALREQQRMLPLLAEHHERATWTVLCASKALQHVRCAEIDDGLRTAQRAQEAALASSIAPADLAVALRYLVDAWLGAGQRAAALAALQALQARLPAGGDYPNVQRIAATVWLAVGRPDLAQRLLQALPAQVQVRQRDRLLLALLQQQAALTRGQARAQPWPEDALAGEDLAMAAEWALWSGLAAESPWPPDAIAAVLARCRESGMALWSPALAALLAWRERRPPPEPAAVGGAQAWEALFAARAWADLGDEAAARQRADAGLRPLREQVAPALPEPCRDSFLRRHPVPRALQALAGAGR